MDKLQAARERIDRADREMAALFSERMAAAKEIAAYKQAHALPTFDPVREQSVIERNVSAYPDDETRALYETFLRQTIALSRAYQEQLR